MTGTETRLRLRNPFQLARGAITGSVPKSGVDGAPADTPTLRYWYYRAQEIGRRKRMNKRSVTVESPAYPAHARASFLGGRANGRNVQNLAATRSSFNTIDHPNSDSFPHGATSRDVFAPRRSPHVPGRDNRRTTPNHQCWPLRRPHQVTRPEGRRS